MHAAQFTGAIIPPTDHRTQYFILSEEEKNLLPKDGLPRITTEGLAILLEGFRGDFSRWCRGIGNHPYGIPGEHLSNLIIRAMNDKPHFIAEFWIGHKWPKTKHNWRAVPQYCFDVVDDRYSEYAADQPPTYIYLRQSSDYWSDAPVFIDDFELWAEGFEDEDDEDEGMVDCVINKPTANPVREEVTTLDRWGF